MGKGDWRQEKGEVTVVLCRHKEATCFSMGSMFRKWLCKHVLRVEFLAL